LYDLNNENEFTLMQKLNEKTQVIIPDNLRGLDKKPLLHNDKIQKSDMKTYILEKVGGLK
nr:threonine synthase [Paeniclostridium ghonii]